MNHLNKITCFLAVFFFTGSVIFSQKQDAKFKHINVEHGLSQNWVHAIVQDTLGFIWIATDNGLNRYDGTNIERYLHNSADSTTISNNTINALCLDSKKDLWIGTSQGLNIYKQSSNSFYRKANWPAAAFLSIAEDEHSNFWWGTYSGLYFYTAASGTYTRYLPCIIRDNVFKLNIGCLSSGQISVVYIDSKKNVWIGTNNGLNLYVKKTDSFINYLPNKNEEDKSLYGNEIYTIFEDHEGRLWVGTNLGLNWFVNSKDLPENGVFMHFKHDKNNPSAFPSTKVSAINEDAKKQLWIGTDNYGISLLDLSKPVFKKEFINIRRSNLNSNGLSSSTIFSIFKDKSDNMWVGTFGKGINLYTPSNENFLLYSHEPVNKNSLNDDEVYAVFNDDNYLWVGNDGLNCLNKKTGKFELFVHDESRSGTIGANAVWKLYKDSDGKLWIGTWGGGLNLFDYKTKSFKTYYNNPKDSTSIGSNNIFSILEDNKKNLWIGTMGGGLSLFNKNTNTFQNFNNQNSQIATNFVEDIVQTSDGYLWLANVVSVERFDVVTHKIKHYRNKPGDSTSIMGKKFFALFIDSKSNFWIGTDEGLNLYQKKTDNFIAYTTHNGLPDNSIRSITEDKQGNLWLGTTKGLSMFKQAVYLPKKSVFKNYTREDGLQGNEFNRRVSTCSNEGYVYMGGSNGLTWFDPLLINENKEKPNVVITDFLLFNEPVVIGAKGSPLKKHISTTDTLILKYTHSVFTFRFTAINYIVPEKNQYAYKLDGFDTNWNYIGNKQEATYTNLSPGKYVFKVKACNNDGVWNETGTSIFIQILPPWWKTWWAQTLLYLSIALLISFLINLRTKFYRNQTIKLTEMVQERTVELEEVNINLEEKQEEISNQNEELLAQRNELDRHRNDLEKLVEDRTRELIVAKNKAEEADKLKSSFLANLSHEIRTPLNAIVGFSSLVLDGQYTPDELAQYKHIIVNSSDSLLSLINDIIDFSKIESGHIDIIVKEYPLIKIIQDVYSVFELQMRRQQEYGEKALKLRVVTSESLNHIYLETDEIRVTQILSNLINNAIKFTFEGYIEVGCRIIGDREMAEFYVKDTGIGIKSEFQKTIFERFIKVEEDKDRLHRGAGIGLAISNQLVNLLGGQIWVESEYGKGSAFYFTIPVKKNPTSIQIKTTNKANVNITDFKGATVLVAEDDLANFAFIEKLLQKLNVRTIHALNGSQAVLLATTHPEINLVLMDIKMPGLDGIQALHLIKEKGILIPIVAQTAYALSHEVIKLKEEGFDDYISKPLNKEGLSRILHKWLKNRE